MVDSYVTLNSMEPKWVIRMAPANLFAWRDLKYEGWLKDLPPSEGIQKQ